MRKITVITDVFAPTKCDGVATIATNLCKNLCELGYSIQLICPKNSQVLHPNLNVVEQPSILMFPEQYLVFPGLFLFRKIKQFDPDVILVLDPRMLGVLFLLFKKLFALKYPVVASYNTDYIKYAKAYKFPPISIVKWLVRTIFKRATKVFAVSQYAADELKRIGVSGFIKVWQGGVDTYNFNPDQFSADMRQILTDNHPDKPLCVYIGRLAREKSIHRLKPLIQSQADVRWAIIGDGELKEDLMREFAEMPIVFTGALFGEPLYQAFATSDLLVFPSTTDTLGLVLLESMASGTPVLAFNHGGVPEIVDHGTTGIYVDYENEEQFLSAFIELISHPRRLQKLSDNCIHKMSQWNWRYQTQEFLKILFE